MDQVKTHVPKILPNPKGADQNNIKTHITGVRIHGKGTDFHIDFNQFKHDPNLVINVLMSSLSKIDQLGSELFIQVDNTSLRFFFLFLFFLLPLCNQFSEVFFLTLNKNLIGRENKNVFIFAFLFLLVKLKIFKRVFFLKKKKEIKN